jgi:hypothetical protein
LQGKATGTVADFHANRSVWVHHWGLSCIQGFINKDPRTTAASGLCCLFLSSAVFTYSRVAKFALEFVKK